MIAGTASVAACDARLTATSPAMFVSMRPPHTPAESGPAAALRATLSAPSAAFMRPDATSGATFIAAGTPAAAVAAARSMRVAAGETNRPNILRAVGSALPAAAHPPTRPATPAASPAADLAAIFVRLRVAALNAPTPDTMSGTNDPMVWAAPPGSKYC